MNRDWGVQVQAEVTTTVATLYATALRLYEVGGESAASAWGDKIGLRSSRCEPCDTETPVIGDVNGTACLACCAVCGSVK